MTLKVVYGWDQVDPDLRGAAVALADFDGVHKGHQHLLAGVRQTASRLGAPLGAVCFEPGPRPGPQDHLEHSRLTNVDQRARLLQMLSVDVLYLLPFDGRLTGMGPKTFARDLLAAGLGVRHATVGSDLASSRIAGFVRYGKAFGFSASAIEDVWSDKGYKFSADAARAALKAGRPELAAEILGRPFAIEGVVVEGQKLGRQLGYPTANVAASSYVRPRLGVYATRSRLPDGREIPGVANFGVNPTTGLVEARLEVWLFDFDEDIYGQMLETDLISFLRPELKFDGLPTMIEQIGKDVVDARAILFRPIDHAALASAVA